MSADERLRLFLALRLPDELRELVTAWQAAALGASGRPVSRTNLHVTLAFLGWQPAGRLGEITAALRASGGRAEPIELAVESYRETRSVGMLVLADRERAAGRLADDLHGRLEALGVYRRERRPWLPHLTVLRFRERPRLRPALPERLRVAFAPSDAAAYLSRLHPTGARYEVLDSIVLGG